MRLRSSHLSALAMFLALVLLSPFGVVYRDFASPTTASTTAMPKDRPVSSGMQMLTIGPMTMRLRIFTLLI
jgi:hypothetical protein